MATYQVETDGGTYQVETDDAPQEQTSALGAAGRGALDAVPFGDKAYAAGAANINNTTYDKELGNLDHQIALDKSQHPIAHDVGEVGGTVAPFMIPGVGEALGAESIAGRAAVGAGMGAVQGASENRDSSQMGTDIAKGAGLGAVAGPVVGAATDLVGGVANAITPSMKEFQAQAGAGYWGPTGRQVSAMRGANPEEALNTINDWGMQAKTPSGERLYNIADHKGDTLRKAVDIHNGSGVKIGDTLKAQNIDVIPSKPILDRLAQVGHYDTPEEKALTQTVIGDITKASNPTNGTIPFEVLHKMKVSLGDAAFPKNGQIKQPLVEAYHIISDTQENALRDIDLPGFKQAKHDYAMSSQVIPMLKRSLGKEIISGTKMGSAVPAAVAGALGGPAAGIGTFAAQFVKPSVERIGRNAIFGAAQGLKNAPNLSGAGDKIALSVTNGLLNHPDMAPYIAAFKGATQGITDPAQIEKANAVTDTLLSQNNPHYAATKSKLQTQ